MSRLINAQVIPGLLVTTMTDTNEYLVAKVGDMKLGIYCRDVKNVYAQRIKLVRLFYQGHIFRGIARVNDKLMQVIDLRRRIGMPDNMQDEFLTLISVQTDVSKLLAVVVDEIIGMKSITSEQLHAHQGNLNNSRDNVNLLFPMVAVLDDKGGELIHILDSTYIDKLEPIAEDAGDLEFF